MQRCVLIAPKNLRAIVPSKGGGVMRKLRKPKYVQEFKDRHGKIRCYFRCYFRRYFRRKDQKPVPLPGVCWTPTFMEHYEAALKASERAIAGESDTPRPTRDWLRV